MIDEKRVDADALLASLGEEGRGKLTVFLGAAAGVGKTFAMLEVARERLAEGMDVVVGWVEVQARPETAFLLEGLPVIPPRTLEYRGKVFTEMDLDAILARQPELILIDELAHTNVPGSRNARRYQDVEELLAAGINVYTTLNIQHVESLNDIIAQITGVIVRETVPDRILEKAQIQLVDIPPEELIQRLKEGKVYVPDLAKEAMRKFFTPGNIIALRELALRYAAQRVERQVETYMRAHGIVGPWPTAERVMVCVNHSPFSAHLIRAGRRTAASLKADWLAVHVETPRYFPASEAEKDSLAKNLRLAEELGAETVTLIGSDVAEELLELARKRNVTLIIVGKSLHPRFREWLRGSVADKIIRHSQGISVHVIQSEAILKQPVSRLEWLSPSLAPYLWVTLITAVITAVLWFFKPFLGLVNIAMVYFLPVLFSAIQWGLGPSVAAAVLGILAFDFFFISPVFSFKVSDTSYLISFGIFLLVAVFIGSLSASLKQQVKNARRREAKLSALYALSREIAAKAELEPVLESIVRKVADTMEGQVVLLLPDQSGKLVLRATTVSPKESFLDENERAVATWVFKRCQIAGRGTDTLGGAKGLYLPLRTEQGCHGVLGIRLNKPEHYLQPEQLHLLEAFAGLAALVITRIHLIK